jgi:hypothetical protein
MSAPIARFGREHYGLTRPPITDQADIVWTARHNASLLAFGLTVHLRR